MRRPKLKVVANIEPFLEFFVGEEEKNGHQVHLPGTLRTMLQKRASVIKHVADASPNHIIDSGLLHAEEQTLHARIRKWPGKPSKPCTLNAKPPVSVPTVPPVSVPSGLLGSRGLNVEG